MADPTPTLAESIPQVWRDIEAAMQTTPLADEHREKLHQILRWHFNAHADQPNQGYASAGIKTIERLVARMVADAKRRALQEAYDDLPANSHSSCFRDELHSSPTECWAVDVWLRDRADRIGGA